MFEHQVAQAKVAVDQAGRNRRRNVGFQPAQRQGEDRPVAAIGQEPRAQFVQSLRRIHHRDRQSGAIGAMRGNQFAGDVADGDGRIGFGQEGIGIGRAGNGPHDIARTDPVFCRQLHQHFGRHHARSTRSADQGRLARVIHRPSRHHLQRRGTAQNTGLPTRDEPPAFHVGPAGKPLQPLGRGQANAAEGHGQAIGQGNGQALSPASLPWLERRVNRAIKRVKRAKEKGAKEMPFAPRSILARRRRLHLLGGFVSSGSSFLGSAFGSVASFVSSARSGGSGFSSSILHGVGSFSASRSGVGGSFGGSIRSGCSRIVSILRASRESESSTGNGSSENDLAHESKSLKACGPRTAPLPMSARKAARKAYL